ncbi:hypothetical protein HanPSC8_Chr01g0030111 [Helianthus annuus]|nr:hypothetical protein HanPSC8_Chr01g0030111 [Helianthus annuus]
MLVICSNIVRSLISSLSSGALLTAALGANPISIPAFLFWIFRRRRLRNVIVYKMGSGYVAQANRSKVRHSCRIARACLAGFVDFDDGLG